jgi:hypothetical protein
MALNHEGRALQNIELVNANAGLMVKLDQGGVYLGCHDGADVVAAGSAGNAITVTVIGRPPNISR